MYEHFFLAAAASGRPMDVLRKLLCRVAPASVQQLMQIWLTCLAGVPTLLPCPAPCPPALIAEAHADMADLLNRRPCPPALPWPLALMGDACADTDGLLSRSPCLGPLLCLGPCPPALPLCLALPLVPLPCPDSRSSCKHKWLVLQESLKLTQEQKSELMRLRSWVLPQVGRLMRDRERISRSLQACTSSQNQQVLYPVMLRL